MWTKEDVIDVYTRAEANADGVLIDVTDAARRAGFRWPVAVTPGVWERCVSMRADADGLSESGKLAELLTTLHAAIASLTGPSVCERVRVDVEEYRGLFTIQMVKVVGGPDDDGSPCLTVMMPDED